MAPAWGSLGQQYQNDPTVAIAQIDCDKYRNTCSSYGITGYPTLKFFANGAEVARYSGARDVASFTTFIKSQTVTTPPPLSLACWHLPCLQRRQHPLKLVPRSLQWQEEATVTMSISALLTPIGQERALTQRAPRSKPRRRPCRHGLLPPWQPRPPLVACSVEPQQLHVPFSGAAARPVPC